MNDIPEWQMIKARLEYAAQFALEQWESVAAPSVRDKLLLDAATYLEAHRTTVDHLTDILPKQHQVLRTWLYMALLRNYAATVLHLNAKYGIASDLKSIRRMLDSYCNAVETIADAHSRLNEISLMAGVSDGFEIRARNASNLQFSLLSRSLRALLPSHYFERPGKWGIDVEAFSDNSRYPAALKAHAAEIRASIDDLASTLRIGRRETFADLDILVHDLAKIWLVGTGTKASAARNSSLDYQSPFYTFFAEAWLALCESSDPPPSPDTIKRALKRKPVA